MPNNTEHYNQFRSDRLTQIFNHLIPRHITDMIGLVIRRHATDVFHLIRNGGYLQVNLDLGARGILLAAKWQRDWTLPHVLVCLIRFIRNLNIYSAQVFYCLAVLREQSACHIGVAHHFDSSCSNLPWWWWMFLLDRARFLLRTTTVHYVTCLSLFSNATCLVMSNMGPLVLRELWSYYHLWLHLPPLCRLWIFLFIVSPIIAIVLLRTDRRSDLGSHSIIFPSVLEIA